MSKLEIAQKMLDTFTDEGWDEIKGYFANSIRIFYTYLKSFNLHHEINFKNIDDELNNEFFLFMMNEDPDLTLKYICDNLLTDVEKRSDGFYFSLRDRKELSDFFADYRNSSPRYVVEKYFSEDSFDWFDNFTIDVYNDVIENLNTKNLTQLYKVLLKDLKDTEISLGTELLEVIASEQDNDEYLVVNNFETIERIMGDSESAEFILDEYAEDIKYELKSLYHSAYESAYVIELRKKIWSELEDIFYPEFIEEKIMVSDNKFKYNEFLKIRDFKSILEQFLSDPDEYRDLYYFGNFTSLLQYMMEEGTYDYLSFHVPDYPYDVDDEINNMFGDYF